MLFLWSFLLVNSLSEAVVSSFLSLWTVFWTILSLGFWVLWSMEEARSDITVALKSNAQHVQTNLKAHDFPNPPSNLYVLGSK